MRVRTPAVVVVALALAVLVLGLWRAKCVLSGPDIDTDAYAHHMIARAILADPRDLAVHWSGCRSSTMRRCLSSRSEGR
jgi:hypothetical protein